MLNIISKHAIPRQCADYSTANTVINQVNEGEKIEKFVTLGKVFQTQTQTKDGRPNPGQKFLTQSDNQFWVLLLLIRFMTFLFKLNSKKH